MTVNRLFVLTKLRGARERDMTHALSGDLQRKQTAITEMRKAKSGAELQFDDEENAAEQSEMEDILFSFNAGVTQRAYMEVWLPSEEQQAEYWDAAAERGLLSGLCAQVVPDAASDGARRAGNTQRGIACFSCCRT